LDDIEILEKKLSASDDMTGMTTERTPSLKLNQMQAYHEMTRDQQRPQRPGSGYFE